MLYAIHIIPAHTHSSYIYIHTYNIHACILCTSKNAVATDTSDIISSRNHQLLTLTDTVPTSILVSSEHKHTGQTPYTRKLYLITGNVASAPSVRLVNAPTIMM